jgi:predicted  nucleic acid-binding Zn-ribbon protein
MKPVSILVPSSKEEPRMGESVERSVWGTRVLWALVILVTLGLAGASWYGYRSLENHEALLAPIPALQALGVTMDGQLSTIQEKMGEWTNQQSSLGDRMAKLEKRLSSSMKAARNQAEVAANQAAQLVREEINQSLLRLQGRVESVESVQRETQDQLAAARTEIGSLRQEIAGLQKENSERLAELHDTQGNVDRLNSQVSAVNNQVTTHAATLTALNNQVEREQIQFELSNSRTQQVVPGIYLTVSHTDVGHQRVDGWMQFANEGRIVWIRGLAAGEALTFVTRSDSRTHELVFSGVRENGATGYVLLPRSAASPLSSAN